MNFLVMKRLKSERNPGTDFVISDFVTTVNIVVWINNLVSIILYIVTTGFIRLILNRVCILQFMWQCFV